MTMFYSRLRFGPRLGSSLACPVIVLSLVGCSSGPVEPPEEKAVVSREKTEGNLQNPFGADPSAGGKVAKSKTKK